MSKRCIYGKSDTPKVCYRGWIIGRKLIDFDGKPKPFTYYPKAKHGKPPYWYNTKQEAINAFNRQKARSKFPGNQPNSMVVKFTEKVYLDRY